MHKVGRYSRRLAAPSQTSDVFVEDEKRSCKPAPRLRQHLEIRNRPGQEQAGDCQLPAKVPVRFFGCPRAVPSKSIAVNQAACLTHLEVLNNPLELESFRQFAALVPAGQPDVAPDQSGCSGEL